MPNYCLECGGNLNYDPVLKQFACKSCGATFTYQELLESKGTIHVNEEDPKKKRQKDYLNWWLSKKS